MYFAAPASAFAALKMILLSDEQWQEKEALITQVGLPILSQTAEAHLAELKELLETPAQAGESTDCLW